MNKFALLFFILFLPVFSFSQDLITKKDGNKIYCRILSVDSTEITYKHPSNKLPLKINRSEVSEYHLSSSARPLPAQGTTGRQEIFLISVFAGQCIPVSDFASKDLQDEKSGLAEEGRSFEGSLLLKVSPFFGLIVSYKSQTYDFDDQIICDALTMYYPGASFRCSSTPWKMRGLFPGVFITFPFNRYPKLLMDLEVTAGLPKYFYPKLVTTGNPSGAYITVTSSSPPVRAISACMGLGLSYRLAPAFAVNAHADYLLGNPDFGSVTTRATGGYVSLSSYEQQVRAINLRLGISLIFGQKEKVKK